ncbi:DUF5336 domain-containing protein [Streptomyces sp. NBC_01463]|uniref:DUF5336 domain-containing protein n=1 Tax=unclassified Streptomyces TaxID=2593676 RepID=UPI002555000B|nr:DUF5336 domain-containing protein [Streptomyces sp. RTGN2]WSU58540.1 DUF5336 domain-containing protein [Streptomyces sp. NBC_01104]
MVIGAAVVLFIASFLDYFDYGSTSVDAPNSWDSLGNGIGVYMVGVIGAALIVLSRSQPQPRKVLGLDLAAFGVAATVFTAWNMFWTIIDLGQIDAGAGLILGLIASLALAFGAVASPLIPALKAPLAGAPKPQAVQPPYGGQPQPGQGYGYPGAQQPPYGGQPQAQAPSYGGQPQPGQPGQQGQPEPQQAQAPAQQAAPAGDFTPFWFAVPVARPLYGEDGSPAPIAELAPGTWYLAVEQRGPGLIAQTQDGRRGVLQDTTGIQRG